MSDQDLMPFHVFDGDADVLIVERRLPHWSQAGTICFITWRMYDSMPNAVLNRWLDDRGRWLRAHGIDSDDPNWRRSLLGLERRVIHEFQTTFWNRWHDELDESHGTCALRSPDFAEIVAGSLHHFDHDRYLLLDFVVMPNHVHLLASFPDEDSMLAQCESWKHFTAMQIDRRLKRRGRFWQQDGFDHLVRSEEQFDYLRRYISSNPLRADLGPREFICYSKRLDVDGKASSRGA